MLQSFQKIREKGHKFSVFSQVRHTFVSNVTKHLFPLSYQSIKDEDVILITLRMFHHDVEEGIQSILEKLDKIMKVALRKSAGDPETHSSVHTQEKEGTHPSRAVITGPGGFAHKSHNLEQPTVYQQHHG